MNKKEYLKELEETIQNHKPIKVYLENEYFDIMEYNKQKDRYECDYGNIPMDKMALILTEDESVDHIRLEVVDGV